MNAEYMTSPTLLRERLKYVTLTGVGSSISFESLHALTLRHPYVEFGVLYSSSLQGHGRFPSIDWIDSLVKASRHERGLNLSLHVFGSDVTSLLKNDTDKYICELVEYFPRIQLNFITPSYLSRNVIDLIKRYQRKTISIRHHPFRFGQTSALSVSLDSTSVSGVATMDWSDTFPDYRESSNDASLLGSTLFDRVDDSDFKQCKLAEQIRYIERATGGSNFWIDMGTCLRNEANEFDMGLAERALAAVDLALFKSRGPSIIQTQPTMPECNEVAGANFARA